MTPEEAKNQLQSKIDEFIACGSKISISDPVTKKLLYSTVLDNLKIANAYAISDERHEFDIGWQPAEFEVTAIKGESNYIINSPFYHHIIKSTIEEKVIILIDFWPDGTSRQLRIERIESPLDEKKFRCWQDFKMAHPEKVANLENDLLDVPWGKLVDHKGCPGE